MQKKSIATVCASIALSVFAVGCVNVGDLASNVPGATGTTKSAGSVDLSGHQDKLLRSYLAAGKDVNVSYDYMISALGIDKEAIKDAATAYNITDASGLEDTQKAMTAKTKIFEEAMKGNATLKSSQAKAEYVKGLIALASGVKKYTGLSKDAQSFSSNLSSVSPLQLGKLQTGVKIVKSLPTDISNLSSTLSTAIKFAKQNGIEVSKDIVDPSAY